MAVQGNQREQLETKVKKVGLGEFKVIAVNPTIEEYKNILGITLAEDSKAADYLGESRDGNTTLRLDFWGENTKTKEKDKVTFFLEDKVKENKIEEEDTDKVKKYQFINGVGSCTWAEDVNDLKPWFTKYGTPRKAFVGEEELYLFAKRWLGKLDTFKADADLSFLWKPLMKGNVSEIRAQINGEFSTPFLWLLTVRTVEKDGETKQYQGVYNRGFLPSYVLPHFSQKDYQSEEVLSAIKAKKAAEKEIKDGGGTVAKELKVKDFEYFVLQVTDPEFGCKDFFRLKPLKVYDPAENLMTSDSPMVGGSDDLPF
jgi:hypothetical protein